MKRHLHSPLQVPPAGSQATKSGRLPGWARTLALGKALMLLIIGILLSQGLAAQEAAPRRNISLELNPLAYAFGGWSIGTAYQPNKIPHWVFNAGAYAFPFPKTFVEQIAGNKGEDFGVKLRLATTLGADVYPWRKDRAGFAFGLAAVLGDFEITQAAETGKARYQSLYFVPRASYTWYIVKGLYVMPWLGVELHNKVAGTTTVGSREFEPIRYQFSPNFMIGYSF